MLTHMAPLLFTLKLRRGCPVLCVGVGVYFCMCTCSWRVFPWKFTKALVLFLWRVLVCVWSGCKRDTVISPLVVLGGVGIGLSPFRLPNE